MAIDGAYRQYRLNGEEVYSGEDRLENPHDETISPNEGPNLNGELRISSFVIFS
jgi:hypothetical protein